LAGNDIVTAVALCYAEAIMAERKRIILFGNTLVLAGVRASLEAAPAFEVIPLDAGRPCEADLLALHPHAIIFDVHSIQPRFHYDMVKKLPGLRLCGIDPDSNQVLLWSGQHLHELSTADLIQALQLSAPVEPTPHSIKGG
jgi:hypothetical protein